VIYLRGNVLAESAILSKAQATLAEIVVAKARTAHETVATVQ
jgi:hypothetical protein